MNWFKNLFIEKKQVEPEPTQVAIRAAEIKSRIAEFKRNYPWSKQIESKPKNPKENVRVNTTSEADILKAKLLGKRL